MDHAEARAWLDDAFFEPGLIARLDDQDASPADTADPQLSAVRGHLAVCAGCSAYTQSLWRTALTLDVAMGASQATKARVLETVRSVGRQRGSLGRPAEAGGRPHGVRPIAPWWRQVLSPRMAAALVTVALLAGMVGGLLGLSAQRSAATDERFAAAVGMLADLAADPDTRQLALRDPSGQAAGAVFLSSASGRIAIFSDPLGPSRTGAWGCYLERDGQITELGPMHDAAGVSYWAGWIKAVPDAGLPGDRLLIGMDEGGEPTLVGTF